MSERDDRWVLLLMMSLTGQVRRLKIDLLASYMLPDGMDIMSWHIFYYRY